MPSNSINIFRFLASIIVVIFHFGNKLTDSVILRSGCEMVTFFIVLSGFVLILRYEHTEVSWKDYAINRVARIVPLYWLALILSFFFPLGDSSTISILLSLTFTQSWIPGYAMALNPPGWAMSVLMAFYILFPLLHSMIRKMNLGGLTIISLVFWLVVQLLISWLFTQGYPKEQFSTAHELIFYSPWAHLCSFLIGVVGGYWCVMYKRYSLQGVVSWIVMFAVLALVMITLEYKMWITHIVGFQLPFASSFFAPLFIVLIIMMTMTANSLTKILSHSIFVLLGEISFGIYLLQSPLMGAWQHFYHMPTTLFELLVFLVGLILMAIACLHYVEKPVAKWIKKHYLLLRTSE